MSFMKPGQPWLYDDTTGDIVGIKDPDGSEQMLTMLKIDPVTGRIRKNIPLIDVKQLPGSGIRRMAGMQIPQTTFAGYTWSLKVELPVSTVSAVRVCLLTSPNGAADWIVTASAMDAWGTTHNGGAYEYGSFGGGSYSSFVAKTIPQKSAGVADEVWSDWITVNPTPRTDGYPFALVNIRAYTTSGNVMTVGHGSSDGGFSLLSAPNLRYATAFKSGDFVTGNWSSFGAGGSAPSCTPIAAVEFITTSGERILSVAHFTDSIGNGYGTTLWGQGPLLQACADIQAEGVVRVSPVLSCWAGEMSEGSVRRFIESVKPGRLNPQIAIFRPYTRNNGGAVYKALTTMAQFAYECERAGVVPILETGIYETADISLNAKMSEVNSAVRAFANTHGIVVLEQEGVINASNAATALVDQIHPSDAGRALLVPRFKAAIKSAAGL